MTPDPNSPSVLARGVVSGKWRPTHQYRDFEYYAVQLLVNDYDPTSLGSLLGIPVDQLTILPPDARDEFRYVLDCQTALSQVPDVPAYFAPPAVQVPFTQGLEEVDSDHFWFLYPSQVQGVKAWALIGLSLSKGAREFDEGHYFTDSDDIAPANRLLEFLHSRNLDNEEDDLEREEDEDDDFESEEGEL